MARRRKKSSLRIKPLVLISGLLGLWLCLSILFGKSPSHLISDSFKFMFGKKDKMSLNQHQWKQRIAEKDSLITSMSSELLACQTAQPYPEGKVVFDGQSVNLRKEADLNSEIITQIPAEAIVYIVSYDERILFLADKQGQWCKVKYDNQVGWVWGNFIQKLNS